MSRLIEQKFENYSKMHKIFHIFQINYSLDLLDLNIQTKNRSKIV